MTENVRASLFMMVGNIPDPLTRSYTTVVLGEVPEYFWRKPSSAGKHHPADEHGDGGLALHTLRVARICWTLCQSRPDINPSVLLSAGILHDIGRYGLDETPAQYTLPDHPDIGAAFIRDICGGMGDTVEEIACAVETHSGRWGRIEPRNEVEWLIHYADCVAANYAEWSNRII